MTFDCWQLTFSRWNICDSLNVTVDMWPLIFHKWHLTHDILFWKIYFESNKPNTISEKSVNFKWIYFVTFSTAGEFARTAQVLTVLIGVVKIQMLIFKFSFHLAEKCAKFFGVSNIIQSKFYNESDYFETERIIKIEKMIHVILSRLLFLFRKTNSRDIISDSI